MQFIYMSEDKWLYILRAVNDAAITWREGMEEVKSHPDQSKEQESEEWAKISAETGQVLAEIFQDISGFYPLTEQDMSWRP